MRSRRLLVPTALVASIVIGACVGDDPVTLATPPGGEDGGGLVDATIADTAAADTSTPHDGAPPDAADAAVPFDAGPPLWTSSLAAGTLTVVASAGDDSCTFQLLSVQAGAPPTYTLYLRKQDTSGAVCNEPKGLRALGTGYSPPTGALLKTQSTKRLVLAYSSKIGLSGSSPVQLRMSQVDWGTGNDLHTALTKTKAIVGMPVTPSLDVTLLFFGDPTEEAAGTVRLKGTGSFPGESGAGAFFYARYAGFLG
ncbi:MAG TPA: hypothetical protein VLT33_42560, partial [Labilithrix sp.]|nr:hypothetical protein [Labilithrix sp.]